MVYRSIADGRLQIDVCTNKNFRSVVSCRHCLVSEACIIITPLVYKCQYSMAQQYFQTYCEPMSAFSSRHIRSAQSSGLTVPRSGTNYGHRSIAVQGPRVWKGVPAEPHVPDTSLVMFWNRPQAFLPRCMKCGRGLAMRILSVRPSVCLPDFYTIRKNNYPSLLRRRMVGGGRPLLRKILGQPTPVGTKSPIFNQ